MFPKRYSYKGLFASFSSHIRARRQLAFALIFAVLVTLLYVAFSSPRPFDGVRLQQIPDVLYERIHYLLSPTAPQAFQYGSAHLDSGRPHSYDIELAERYFLRTVQLEPAYPYAYHQLARIAFLRGNFDPALAFINIEIKNHGEKEPNAYYVRALIEGFKGDYAAAAKDYEHYLESDPRNWAAINDYAWVLLKGEEPSRAAFALEEGLHVFPENAWLLNSYATALYELGDIEKAREQGQKALAAVSKLTEADWLLAYPGNDPRTAAEGLSALQDAVRKNMHTLANPSR